MNRRVVMLNLTLLALAGVLGWRIYVSWGQAQQHEQTVLSQTPPPAEVLPPPAAPPVAPATPADYIDVAQRTLFSRDRDPNVIVVVEAPPPPPPPPPLPDLPRYHGQMSLGEPVVVLSYSGEQKSYHAGEKIGEFTVVGWDQAKLTLDWNGKEVVRDLDALRPAPNEVAQARGKRAPGAAQKGAVAQGPARQGAIGEAPPAVANAQHQAPRNQGEIGKSAAKGDAEPALGREVGAFRTCVAGDTSPAGTVKDGYKKVISQTLMGPDCHWERTN